MSINQDGAHTVLTVIVFFFLTDTHSLGKFKEASFT